MQAAASVVAFVAVAIVAAIAWWRRLGPSAGVSPQLAVADPHILKQVHAAIEAQTAAYAAFYHANRELAIQIKATQDAQLAQLVRIEAALDHRR